MVMNRIKQSARQEGAKKLGEILVQAGALDEDELNAALAVSHEQNRRLGEVLVEMRLISPLMLKAALEEQLRVRSEDELIGQLEFSIAMNTAPDAELEVASVQDSESAARFAHNFQVLADNAAVASDQALLQIAPITPVLSASVSPDTIPEGEWSEIVYTVRLEHQYPLPVRNALLVGNSFPKWIKVHAVSIDGEPAQLTEQGELTLGDIAPGTVAEVTLSAQAFPNATGGHLHTFHLRSDNARPINADVALVVTPPVKTVLAVKAGVSPETVHEDQKARVSISLTVENHGKAKAKGLVLQDVDSPRWLAVGEVSIDGMVRNDLLGDSGLPLPDLEPDKTMRVTIVAEGTPFAAREEHVALSVSADNAQEATATASFGVEVSLKTFLSIEKTVSPDSLPENQEGPVTVTLIIRNGGRVPARDVYIKGEEKPSWCAVREVKVGSGVLLPSLLYGDGLFLGDIPGNSEKVVCINAVAGPASGGNYTLAFRIQGGNVDDVEERVPMYVSGEVKTQLRVEESVYPEVIPEGEVTPVVYTITITNQGSAHARNVVISESSFPDWLQIKQVAVDSVINAATFSADGKMDLGDIPMGGTREVKISGIAYPPVAAKDNDSSERHPSEKGRGLLSRILAFLFSLIRLPERPAESGQASLPIRIRWFVPHLIVWALAIIALALAVPRLFTLGG